jgi:hypothetical protein
VVGAFTLTDAPPVPTARAAAPARRAGTRPRATAGVR